MKRAVNSEKILPLKYGDKIQCIAVESDFKQQKRFSISCVGKSEDGRIILFDKESGLSKAIKPGDRIEGSIIVAKPKFIIISPENIVEQTFEVERSPDEKVEEEQRLESSRWDHSLIISIRREKEKQKSPDLERALELISKALYGEKTHYVLELIQNAEDEGASGISFTILDEQIKVWNNGKPFNREDVFNICSVRGGKRNKIGFFGIGFKSVFNVTNKPQVISERYNFMIEKFIYPIPCNTDPPDDFDFNKGAWFILPYDQDEHNPEDFERSMKQLDEKVLLFLQNLKEITFMNVVSGNSWYLERKELEGDIVSLYNSSTGTQSLWKVFSEDLKVPKEFQVMDGLREKPVITRVAVAFPIPSNGEVPDVTSEPIYCYLPTKKRTDMPFLIQGDFDPTIGRENIKDNDWNKWLLLKIGELAVEAYQLLIDQGIAHDLLFRCIPANEEVKDPALRDVYENMAHRLKNHRIAPTEDGRWVTPSNVIVDTSNGNLKSLIGNDIRKLKSHEVGYLDSTVGERGCSILLELGAQEITLSDLIDFLQKDELLKDRAAKGPEWFLQLYAYLGQEFYQNKIPSDRSLYEDQLDKLRSSRILLTARNELIAVKDPEKPNVVVFYPHKVNLNEEYKAFSEGEVDFIHHHFQKRTILRRKVLNPSLELIRDKAKEFLDFLGVRLYYDDYTIINDVICRRLGDPDKFSDQIVIRYTDFVRQNIKRYISLARSKYQTTKNEQEILQGLGERLTIKVFYSDKGGRSETFSKVSEAYLSESYGETSMAKLFEGIPNVFFLAEIYANDGDAKKWSEFFQKIGIWTCPRITTIESTQISYAEPLYTWVPFQGYSGKHVLEEDWVSPELQAFFVHVEPLDKEAKSKRFELLWKALNENWNRIYQKADSCTYVWTPISQPRRMKVKNTSFLNLLLTNPWVLTSDGSLCKPTKLFLSIELNRMLLGNSVKFLAFEGHLGFIRTLKVRETPTKQEVMNHLKQLRLQGVSYTEHTIEKFRTMYSYLMELSEKPTDDETQEFKKIKNLCESEELIYIPRKDKEWWSPSKVFWKDHSQIFSKMRGYLSSSYNPDVFPIFEKMGIKETADLQDCIAVLKEVSEGGEVKDPVQAIINSVYLECDRLLTINHCQEGIVENLKGLNLLTRPKSGKSEFAPVSNLVFADDEQLANIFAEDLKILWLGCFYSEVSRFLEALQIKALSSIVQVGVKAVDVTDVSISVVETVREWQRYLELWVRYKKPKIHSALIEGFEKLGSLQILEAQEIQVTYKLKEDSAVTKSSTNDVYYDKQQNTLYLSASLDPYAPKIASEICRIFVGGETLKEPILALLSVGEDDKKRIEVFEQFGIPKEGLPRLIMEKVEAKQIEETREDIKILELQKLGPSDEQEQAKPQPSKATLPKEIIQFGPILINPDDFVPYEVIELDVSSPPQNSTNVRPVVRVAKKAPPANRRRTITVTVSPQLPEDVAFDLVKKFEESEKRTVDETPRNQKNVGYDLSSSDATYKRFVDIKSSKYDNITITITGSEWRKAELEGDNYYLYIVTGLRAGGTPKLRIIQNPIEHLKPDVPSRVNISSWEHAVRYEVRYSKRD